MSNFCRRPFTEINVEPDGTISPCCLIKPANVNDFNCRDLESYKESPALKELQRALLNDEKPAACEVCWNNEKCGIASLRAPEPSKYRIDEGKFREIHIKISSICNYKCRMCGPFSSSAWLAEQRKFEMGMQDLMAAIPAEQTQFALKEPKFREEMFSVVIPNTQLIRVSGGEPLLCAHSLEFFKELVRRGLTNKHIFIYTNLSALSFAGVNYIEFWKQFPKLKLLVSCDGAGEHVEYSRTGLKWNEFLANLEAVRDRVHSINCVINIYSVYSIPELVKTCQRMNLKVYLGSVFRKNMSVQMLPLNEKSKIKEFYDEFVKRETGVLPAEELDYVYKTVLSYLFSEDDSQTNLPGVFKRKNEELDRRRHTDFRRTFPQLSDWYASI
ncbi:MAG: twitch domain-containing radical SAM protein [Pseudobdellovibrionaceae bacterium]